MITKKAPQICRSILAYLHDQTKSGFFGGPFSSQSEQFKRFLKALIGRKKATPPKKPLLF